MKPLLLTFGLFVASAAPLLANAGDPNTLPDVLNPLHYLKLIEKGMLPPYVEKGAHACESSHRAACADAAPNDPGGKAFAPGDLTFNTELFNSDDKVMQGVLKKWAAFSDKERAEMDDKSSFLSYYFAKEKGFAKTAEKLEIQLAEIIKITSRFDWLPKEDKEALARQKILQEFGNGLSLFGSGVAQFGGVVFQGNFTRYIQSPHARIFMMAHEVGHVIQNSKFGAAAQKCLSSKLKLSLGQKIENGTSQEVFADWFGHQVFAAYVSELKLRPEEKREVVSNGFRILCGDTKTKSGIHPQSEPRINFALSNPGLNEIACHDYKGKRFEPFASCTPEEIGKAVR